MLRYRALRLIMRRALSSERGFLGWMYGGFGFVGSVVLGDHGSRCTWLRIMGLSFFFGNNGVENRNEDFKHSICSV